MRPGSARCFCCASGSCFICRRRQPERAWPACPPMSRRGMRWAALLLLVAGGAVAEVPGGHLYFAGGAYWSLPADGKGPHNWSPTRKDVAFSLELAYELERAFVAVGGIATGADR